MSFAFDQSQMPTPSNNDLDESLETIKRLSQGYDNNNLGLSSKRASTNLEQIRRVIVLGDPKVGKTSIVRRIVDDTFNKDYDNTVNYDIVRMMVDDSMIIVL